MRFAANPPPKPPWYELSVHIYTADNGNQPAFTSSGSSPQLTAEQPHAKRLINDTVHTGFIDQQIYQGETHFHLLVSNSFQLAGNCMSMVTDT